VSSGGAPFDGCSFVVYLRKSKFGARLNLPLGLICVMKKTDRIP